MLHLRVISSSNRSAAVLRTLAAEPGVTHVTLALGAAIDPPGDVIEADVARACANDVLAALAALDLVRTGGISFEPAGTVLSRAGERAEAATPTRREEAVVWEQLLGQVREGARLTPTFLVFLSIAFLLSAVGVATASPLTLVGAMVVGPEFRPLAALSVGLVRRDFGLIRSSARTLAISFPVAMVVTALATLLWIRLGWIGTGDVENARVFDFIYEVGPFSLVVALLAGAAGMLALVTYASTVLVGVFISVTTVPAAGLAVVAVFAGKWSVMLSSLGQLGVNLIGIVLAGVAVLLVLQRAGRTGGSVISGSAVHPIPGVDEDKSQN
ncbi:DUF389 domain-containing protein [Rhodococcus sp. ABRD24]|uniref:DUF389 domain-containing protein n=1 Tax=Rhodococcus sp. ABRD24 TaxID=2507582 RepID=UPI00103B6650|nr:DUF389 domain-containing protein [Rhodococcus sp. ABRD24]QBJ98186.1 DUF389 domain-containing protein [Rhodococcus sp. ABRD24]